jgi:hypothetical protein
LGGYGKLVIFCTKKTNLEYFSHEIADGSEIAQQEVCFNQKCEADLQRNTFECCFREEMQILNFVSLAKGTQNLG